MLTRRNLHRSNSHEVSHKVRDDDDECLLALTFVTITHNGVATNREMTYVNI